MPTELLLALNKVMNENATNDKPNRHGNICATTKTNNVNKTQYINQSIHHRKKWNTVKEYWLLFDVCGHRWRDKWLWNWIGRDLELLI